MYFVCQFRYYRAPSIAAHDPRPWVERGETRIESDRPQASPERQLSGDASRTPAGVSLALSRHTLVDRLSPLLSPSAACHAACHVPPSSLSSADRSRLRSPLGSQRRPLARLTCSVSARSPVCLVPAMPHSRFQAAQAVSTRTRPQAAASARRRRRRVQTTRARGGSSAPTRTVGSAGSVPDDLRPRPRRAHGCVSGRCRCHRRHLPRHRRHPEASKAVICLASCRHGARRAGPHRASRRCVRGHSRRRGAAAWP